MGFSKNIHEITSSRDGKDSCEPTWPPVRSEINPKKYVGDEVELVFLLNSIVAPLNEERKASLVNIIKILDVSQIQDHVKILAKILNKKKRLTKIIKNDPPPTMQRELLLKREKFLTRHKEYLELYDWVEYKIITADRTTIEDIILSSPTLRKPLYWIALYRDLFGAKKITTLGLNCNDEKLYTLMSKVILKLDKHELLSLKEELIYTKSKAIQRNVERLLVRM